MVHKTSTTLGGVTNLSVMAPIKIGLVEGFEPISYLERLRKVLDALHSARRNKRESELFPPLFPDSIGRFGIIHHFRYAIVPPDSGAASHLSTGLWRLSLNVTFDGGWEPYMRIIYRDLGTLLDLLFCHCNDYPGSRRSRFEDYCRWVRENEVESGTFYTDSMITLGDQRYLAAVEKIQREHTDPVAADNAIARYAVPSTKTLDQQTMTEAARLPPATALALSLRSLKGLYRLSVYFPWMDDNGADGGDGATLLRFTQRILEAPRSLIKKLEASGNAEMKKIRRLFSDELSWLDKSAQDPVTRPPVKIDLSKVQDQIFDTNEATTHGCIALLRIDSPAKAIDHLSVLAKACGPTSPDEASMLVSLTYAGLSALEISSDRLDLMPQEFVDGMEARCGLLGDVRGNHPDYWARPLVYGQEASGRRIDMSVVHVVVQLRFSGPKQSSPHLLDALKTIVDDLQKPATGLTVISVQPTRVYRKDAEQSGHFGFVDGISQPEIHAANSESKGAVNCNSVSAGELLLGHSNDRGDTPNPEPDPLQMNGSFLVIRKLRQRVDNLDTALEKVDLIDRAELLSKMMGRQMDGAPLTSLSVSKSRPNDFDFVDPIASVGCPYQSHIRRANPRDGRAYTPRILRRGMSYGPKSEDDRTTERGIVFMAYCASIAEQFETIQRWIAGGNSSGIASTMGDPFLRVPKLGESHTFRYIDDQDEVARITFDDKPFVQLEWGVYLFVPSLEVLADLHRFKGKVQPESRFQAQSGSEYSDDGHQLNLEDVRQRLEDPARSIDEWRKIRLKMPDAIQGSPYGRLVGDYKSVLEIMKDKNDEYSVKGYGDRMKNSIGLNLLGIDPPQTLQAQEPLNRAIATISEKEAFNTTSLIVEKLLSQFPNLPSASEEDPQRRPIDLISFSDLVMAKLCNHWIGLPRVPTPGEQPFVVPGGRQEHTPTVPRCPGNFATASRYIFSPHPRDEIASDGQVQGKAVLDAVDRWLGTNPSLGKLAESIKSSLPKAAGTGKDSLSHALTGVMLGFPPTVQGNFIRTMETWIEDQALWRHQQSLFDERSQTDDPFMQAQNALRKALLATMCERPVPEMLWRSPKKKGAVDLNHTNRVILGIASALTDKSAPRELMFGRDEPNATTKTIHGCPGYAMAMGVLLGMITGIMKAGTLRPTGSPVLLILTPP